MASRFPRSRPRLAAALVGVGLALAAATAPGAEDSIDTDLMQTIEDTNKSLASNLALGDAQRATADGQELGQMFAQVEAFYANKSEAADAVALAKKSRELSAHIVELIAARDFRAASGSATDLSRTCKTCHNFYKKS